MGTLITSAAGDVLDAFIGPVSVKTDADGVTVIGAQGAVAYPAGAGAVTSTTWPDAMVPTDAAVQHYRLSGGTLVAVGAPTTLPARVAAMCAAVDARLAQVIAAGASYTVAGTTYHGVQVDQVSQDRLQAMAICASYVKQGLTTWPGAYTGWLLADNATTVPLATADAGAAFAVAMNAWVAQAVVNSHALKAAIRASSTPEAVDISTGWPAA